MSARKLTVLQLLPALNAGGVEKTTLEVAQALVAQGHRAVVISAGGRMLPQLLASGAEHIALDIGAKSLRTLTRIPALRQVIRDINPDIVHARSRLPAWLARAALHGLPMNRRPRWLTTVHGLNSPSWYSRVMVSGERVICVSQTVRDYVLQHYGDTVTVAQLTVIEPGIEAAAFPARVAGQRQQDRSAWAEQEPFLAGDAPLLLLPGRGTRLKGHHDAIQLLRHVPTARLWLLGADDPQRQDYLAELRALAEQLAVSERLLISPPSPQIAAAMRASDLVLQLSRKPEAFGRTVIESLQSGVPVVGWDHGGAGELLRELYPHGAVTPFDETALAATVQSVLADPAAIPMPACVPYTLQRMQARTLALYQDLVQSPR